MLLLLLEWVLNGEEAVPMVAVVRVRCHSGSTTRMGHSVPSADQPRCLLFELVHLGVDGGAVLVMEKGGFY